MKKQAVQTVIILGMFLMMFILLLQLIRLDKFHQWFPYVSSAEQDVETMTGEMDVQGEPLTIYLHENDSDLSRSLIENLTYSLDYAKVEYEEIERDQLAELSPSRHKVLVLAGEHSGEWPRSDIERFVEGGGNLFVGARFLDPSWNSLVGIEQSNGFTDALHGMQFKEVLHPAYPNIGPESRLFTHSSIDVVLNDAAKVLAEAEGTPVLWSHSYGEGNVMFWNTTAVVDKNTRGLLLRSLAQLPPVMVSAQAAIKVMHIDDFPAPLPFETSDIIQQEFDLSTKDFYTDIWWEDMKNLAESYDLAYTGYLIGTYRDDTQLVGEGLVTRNRYPMLFFGRSLLSFGGEIGLHGYNHQSLVTGDEPLDPELGYVPWEDQEQMARSIEEVQEMFHYYFPQERLTTYVPPSNILNETGKHALAETLPHLTTIAGLYTGNEELGSYVQEYEFDEELEGLYHFPRISSGYVEGEVQKFVQADALANFGMFAHFVHPDDVMDPYRSNGMTWSEMRGQLTTMGEFLSRHFSYTEPLVQSSATKKMIQYQESDLKVRYTDEAVFIEGQGIVDPTVLYVKVEKGKYLLAGEHSFGRIQKVEDAEGLYLVTMTSPTAKIEIKGDLS
ncbi:DUF2194 domain-containing protein [Halobacillus fulvus]|nr:DUF2194 domain-containing protein [Halobacillus fulvus]